jgi:hypothetical protein
MSSASFVQGSVIALTVSSFIRLLQARCGASSGNQIGPYFFNLMVVHKITVGTGND